jgi:hypothetical protein
LQKHVSADFCRTKWNLDQIPKNSGAVDITGVLLNFQLKRPMQASNSNVRRSESCIFDFFL